jgi:hypothetical protein
MHTYCLRGRLVLGSTIEELLERKSSGSGLEKRDYGHRGLATLTTRHPSIRKTSSTSGGLSVGIALSRTQTTEHVVFRFCLLFCVRIAGIVFKCIHII